MTHPRCFSGERERGFSQKSRLSQTLLFSLNSRGRVRGAGEFHSLPLVSGDGAAVTVIGTVAGDGHDHAADGRFGLDKVRKVELAMLGAVALIKGVAIGAAEGVGAVGAAGQGIAGQVIMEQNGVRNFRYISSVNIRVAHQVRGCADAVMPYLTSQGNVYNTLIITPPGCGKTTLLRDMIRQIANGCDHLKGKTVGVVDERSELGGCYLGIRQNDLGVRTDLLDACPKADGMLMLIRSMGPEVIAVDEIGSEEEVGILRYAMHCGCRTLATVHGESYQEIRDKPLFEEFFRLRLFERYIVLCRGERIGQLEGVYDHQGTKIC